VRHVTTVFQQTALCSSHVGNAHTTSQFFLQFKEHNVSDELLRPVINALTPVTMGYYVSATLPDHEEPPPGGGLNVWVFRNLIRRQYVVPTIHTASVAKITTLHVVFVATITTTHCFCCNDCYLALLPLFLLQRSPPHIASAVMIATLHCFCCNDYQCFGTWRYPLLHRRVLHHSITNQL
jgi:hypothetical protein